MVSATYTVSSTFTNVAYAPEDHTPYVATATTGQRLNIFYPDGSPSDYPDVYGRNPSPQTRWKTVIQQELSGGAGAPDGTNSAAPETEITTADSFIYQALARGFAVVNAQMTAAGAVTGLGVTGLGFVHLPGGTAGYYESKARPSAIKDSALLIQHLRFNTRQYAYGDSRSYKLSDWIALYASNSGFSLPWVGVAPSRAGELGSGGPYEESTVPNVLLVQAILPFNWMKFLNNEATTGALFVQAESGGTGVDDVVATTIATAPQRYVKGLGAYQLISDIGEPCFPKTIAFSNTPPHDMNFGEPHVENVRAYATGVHDSWHLYCLKQAAPPGWVTLHVPNGAQFTKKTATLVTAPATVQNNTITAGYHDGPLTGPTTLYAAAAAAISISAGNAADGDTMVISDGLLIKYFEFDPAGVAALAGHTAITIGGTNLVTMDNVEAAITASGLALSFTPNTPSTSQTNFASTTLGMDADVTWTKSGANITILGLQNGVPGGQSIADESYVDGKFIAWLVAHKDEPRWDEKLPPAGIRRSSQVNTTPRCIVPNADGNGRDGVRLACTSMSCDSDLLYGSSVYNCRKRLRPGEEVWIAGQGKVWAKSEAMGTQVAKYEARECDERSK